MLAKIKEEQANQAQNNASGAAGTGGAGSGSGGGGGGTGTANGRVGTGPPGGLAALFADHNPFVAAREAQRLVGSYPEDDVARASLEQLNEISRRAAAAGMSFNGNGAPGANGANGVNGRAGGAVTPQRILQAAAGMMQSSHGQRYAEQQEDAQDQQNESGSEDEQDEIQNVTVDPTTLSPLSPEVISKQVSQPAE